MEKRYFSPEFKQHICRLVVKEGREISKVYKDHNIDRQTMHRWVLEYTELGDNAFVDKSLVTASGLAKKQARRIRELEEEVEILKKAIAYSTRKKSD
jgi:transposase-like protein